MKFTFLIVMFLFSSVLFGAEAAFPVLCTSTLENDVSVYKISKNDDGSFKMRVELAVDRLDGRLNDMDLLEPKSTLEENSLTIVGIYDSVTLNLDTMKGVYTGHYFFLNNGDKEYPTGIDRKENIQLICN